MSYEQHVDKYDDENDDRTVASRCNLAVSLRFVGRFTEAEAIDRVDHERLPKLSGLDDRRALRTINALAEDLYGPGRYADLLALLTPLLVL